MDELVRRRRPRRIAGRKNSREHAVLSGFAPQSMIMTEDGPTPLEWLGEGDRVLTRGGSFEPVLWIDRSRLDMAALRDLPELAPVRIARGVLHDDLAEREMLVSPSQLIHVHRDPAHVNGDGVLIAARALGTPVDPRTRPMGEAVTYISVLLPAHHLIHVDGVWAGSLFLADLAQDFGDDDPLRAALDSDVMQPVAPILGAQEAAHFLAARATMLDRRRA